MSSAYFYITENLSKNINQNQLDAIQAACKSAAYTLKNGLANSKIIDNISKNKNFYILSDAIDFVFFVNKAKNLISQQFILMPNEKDLSVFEKYQVEMKGIRFLLGLITPDILKVALLQILTFQKPNAKGFHELLNLKSPQILAHTIQHSAERESVQKKVAEFFSKHLSDHKEKLVAGSASYAKILSDIVDEFLMNAIWDACPARNTIDRTQPVALAKEEYIELKCLFSETTLILTVEDKFGTFKGEGIAKYIRFGVGYKEAEPIKEGSPGAGLGLFMTLQKIGLLIFEVEKGRFTRATVVARGEQSIRDVQRKPKTVLFFEK